MSRIQRVSAVLRTFFFATALLASLGGILLIVHGLALHQPHLEAKIGIVEDGVRSLAWAVGLWFGYRLFKFYAAGDLFSSRVVGCLKQIGGVAILIGIVRSSALVINNLASLHHPVTFSLVAMSGLQLFLSVIPGFAFFCVAWIMDEGRKIREEQELTV